MSVLIKGLAMPADCWSSPCASNDLWCRVCDADVSAHGKDSGTRPDWCPLVEVPPHGRLIDADVLMGKIEHDTPSSSTFERQVRWYVENAPTVIEAEGVQA